MVQFDSSLGCKIQPEKIDMQSEETGKDHAKEKHHGEHSNFVANFNVACEKSVTGSKMKIDFTTFPKLNDLDITVLVGDLQKKRIIKKPVDHIGSLKIIDSREHLQNLAVDPQVFLLNRAFSK